MLWSVALPEGKKKKLCSNDTVRWDGRTMLEPGWWCSMGWRTEWNDPNFKVAEKDANIWSCLGNLWSLLTLLADTLRHHHMQRRPDSHLTLSEFTCSIPPCWDMPMEIGVRSGTQTGLLKKGIENKFNNNNNNMILSEWNFIKLTSGSQGCLLARHGQYFLHLPSPRADYTPVARCHLLPPASAQQFRHYALVLVALLPFFSVLASQSKPLRNSQNTFPPVSYGLSEAAVVFWLYLSSF